MWRKRILEVEAPCRCVGKGMVEDVQRLIVLIENELEVVVVGGVGDGDRNQIRRSSPEQRDRDSVTLARRQFRPPGVVFGFGHLVIPSLGAGRHDSTRFRQTAFWR